MKSDRKELLFFSTASVVAAFIYYGRFLHNFFVGDDYKYIENIFHGPLDVMFDYYMRSGVLREMRIISNSLWWPLYSISGFDPFIYNLFSLILHSANAVLIYLFLSRLLKDRGYAVLGGILFLFSAAGCDAVFWKAASSSLISLLFYLSTLYTYVAYRQKGSRIYFTLSILFFLLAMFSKEEAASLPLMLILIEMVFFGGVSGRVVLRRVAPYAAVVLFYILMDMVVFNYLLHTQAGLPKNFKFRPLYTLFGGWAVFFLPPQGILKMSDPAIYLTALGVILSFSWVKDKKVLYFGYGWIFISFLPQSLTGLGQFEPEGMSSSISRYLYITSIGSSIILAAVILRLRERLPAKICYPAAAVILSLFVLLNYGRVQARGGQWRDQGVMMKEFLYSIKKKIPDFPPDSYIIVIDAPEGRSFIQQALRAFYKRTDISWVFNTAEYTRKPGESAFLVVCNWRYDGGVDLAVYLGNDFKNLK
jgi:hypothetical protein